MACPKCNKNVTYQTKAYYPNKFIGFCAPCGNADYEARMGQPYNKVKKTKEAPINV